MAKVRLVRRGGRGRLNWEAHRRKVEVMRAMVKAAKEKCWRDFHQEKYSTSGQAFPSHAPGASGRQSAAILH